MKTFVADGEKEKMIKYKNSPVREKQRGGSQLNAYKEVSIIRLIED